MFYLKYALKSITQRRKQYTSLFAVCAVSVCIVLALISVCDGMLGALNKKAVQYYGGELQLICGNRWDMPSSPEKVEMLSNVLSELNLDCNILQRFDYDGTSTEFYFEGQNTYCRILKGIDYSEENDLLSKYTLTEGSIENVPKGSILLSQPVAEKLGCHAGDSITVMVKTIYGHINTLNLYVTGIFQDSSLFGMYTSYLDIETLRELTSYPSYYVNRIGFYPQKGDFTKKDLENIQNKLSEVLRMAPIPESKERFTLDHWTDSNALYALITLEANRPEVTMMSTALQLIVYLIIIPLVLIVAIGIGCSYRVVILKRIVETSTFRALGLKSRGVEKLFFVEVLLILLFGFILGTGLSFVLSGILGSINFSFIPAFDLFLIGGKIVPSFSAVKIIGVLAVISLATLVSVYVTLRKIIHLSPAKAFATTV